MDNASKENPCDGCTHLLISGVACDWRPGECPFIMASQSAHYFKSESHTPCAIPLPAQGEFDVIRSNN
jgi:hypothetical protein